MTAQEIRSRVANSHPLFAFPIQTILLISWSLYKLCFPYALCEMDFQGNHAKLHMIALTRCKY